MVWLLLAFAKLPNSFSNCSATLQVTHKASFTRLVPLIAGWPILRKPSAVALAQINSISRARPSGFS